MEIFNKNKRRLAIWRLTGLSVFILALLGTGMVAMHNSYENQGMDEVLEINNALKDLQAKYDVDVVELQNRLARKEKAYQLCLKNKDCNLKIEKLEMEIEELKEDKKDLKKEAEFYEEAYKTLKLSQ